MSRLVIGGCAAAVLALLTATTVAQSTTLTVHHNANLRAQPTTQSSILDHLIPGDELTLEEPSKTNGFWHVRTASSTVGWVYQTLVHVEEPDVIPTMPAVTGVSDSIDSTWEKPPLVGSVLNGPPGTNPCPADGEPGGDLETNKRKNRSDTPTNSHDVLFSALQSLPFPDASTNRKNWTSEQIAQIAPFEGIPISVVGYIVAVKKQFGGSGEATNCHFSTMNFVDTHVALVDIPGDGEKDAIVVEPTPRFYAQHPTWVYTTLKTLEDSPDPVRISGWILMDPVHKGHLGTYRSTLWEIHPVTKIEVFRNGQWAVF